MRYLLPILERINIDRQVQTVIIVPTNELVRQVAQMLVQIDNRFIVKHMMLEVINKKILIPENINLLSLRLQIDKGAISDG